MNFSVKKNLIPAIALLLVSILTLSGATYAWFTMSRTVTVTGITLNVTAPNNLLISNDNGVTDPFKESSARSENYGTAKLYAASSMTGANGTFFAAKQSIGTSGAPTASTIFLSGSDVTPVSLDTNGYYADFHFWIKTTGADDVALTISRLAASSSVSDTGTTTLSKAVRAAILKPDGTMFSAAAKNVYAFGNQSYFAGINGPITSLAGNGWQGVSDTALTDGTGIFTAEGGLLDAANPATEIIIRVWIEGQDTDCISANATGTFNLQLTFADVGYAQGIS